MGCWHGSCAVTGLSIMHGDRIVLIPLVSNYGVYFPAWHPFRGEYNDGGSIEKIDRNPIVDMFEEVVLKNGFFENEKPSSKDDEDDEDISFGPPKMNYPSPQKGQKIWYGSGYVRNVEKEIPKNLEEFFKAVERQMCSQRFNENTVCYFNHRRWTPIAFMMVHEKIYDHLVSTVELNRWVVEKLNGESSWGHPRMNLMDATGRERFDSLLNYELPILKMSDEDFELFKKEHLDYFKFRDAFDMFRKPYAPPAMAGSQDDNLDEMKKLNTFTNKFIKDLSKERDIRYDC